MAQIFKCIYDGYYETLVWRRATDIDAYYNSHIMQEQRGAATRARNFKVKKSSDQIFFGVRWTSVPGSLGLTVKWGWILYIPQAHGFTFMLQESLIEVK